MVYKVLIEETQRMTVEIEANTPDEANRKATDGYENGDYDLDRSSDREYSVNVCCPDCGEFGALLGEWIDPADANYRGLICNMCGYCTGW